MLICEGQFRSNVGLIETAIEAELEMELRWNWIGNWISNWIVNSLIDGNWIVAMGWGRDIVSYMKQGFN